MTSLREALWQKVFDELVLDISLRRIAPGTHIGEVATAQSLGVSRNPVREALRALEREGWVEFRPAFGTFVKQPSHDEAIELFHVRDLLESEAVRLACRHVTEADLSALEAILAEGYDAVQRQDSDAIVELNNAFHDSILSSAKHGVLTELLNKLRRRVAWYFAEVAVHRGPDSWEEHRELVDALRRGDESQAVTIMQQHWRETARLYMNMTSVSAAPGGQAESHLRLQRVKC